MLRSILTTWRPVALAVLLALAAAPVNVWAAGHGGGYHAGGYHAGGYHGGGYHAGGFHYGGYHASGYRPGYFSGYHNGYGYDHRGYSAYGGYYAPLLYGSAAYTSPGYDLTPDYNYSPGSTTTMPDYGLSAYYTPGVTASAPAVTAPTAAPSSTSGPATVDVHVPASAQLWFDGFATNPTGAERQFVSPSLTPSRDYTYDIRARWIDNGKVVDETRRITVHANGVTSVDFTQPNPAGSASK